MSEAQTVRVIKFDAGSPTDRALAELQSRLGATSNVEAMRRGVAIANKITELAAGHKIYVKGDDGQMVELVIS